MNNSFNGADVSFWVEGKQIGALQTVSYNQEYEMEKEKQIKNGGDLSLFSLRRGATITCENVEISPEFVNMFLPMNKTFKVVGTGYKFPRGDKLPKKKRIRNKWIKKYQHEFVLNDCVIV